MWSGVWVTGRKSVCDFGSLVRGLFFFLVYCFFRMCGLFGNLDCFSETFAVGHYFACCKTRGA